MSPSDQRAALLELAALERGSAGPVEERAARILAGMLRERGLEPVLESESAVGGYWQSTGLAAAAAALAGVLGGRRARGPRRAASFGPAAVAAAAIADDVDGGRHALRRLLPKRATSNVLAWAGDASAPETVVIVAHHDAAHTGLL